MRHQGKISDWKDERGFGFVMPNGGDKPVFIHISAFPRGQARPQVGELISYELTVDPQKGPRATEARFVERPQAAPPERPRSTHRHSPERRGFGSRLMPVLLLSGLLGGAMWGYGYFVRPAPAPLSEDTSSYTRAQPATSELSGFRCEGKTHCSQMNSCEEATFYLRNCPGTQMDGDGDGIPCESQWCGH